MRSAVPPKPRERKHARTHGRPGVPGDSRAQGRARGAERAQLALPDAPRHARRGSLRPQPQHPVHARRTSVGAPRPAPAGRRKARPGSEFAEARLPQPGSVSRIQVRAPGLRPCRGEAGLGGRP